MVFAIRAQGSFQRFRSPQYLCKTLSTLVDSPHIYIFPASKGTDETKILTLLTTDPPNPRLAIGTTSTIPPTPDSFDENPNFLPILNSILKKHAVCDPDVQAQAKVFASQAGSGPGGYATFLPKQHESPTLQRKARSATVNAGSASAVNDSGVTMPQGDIQNTNRGGWIHVSDHRNPPDFGRIAEPEDIFGSLNVDGHGNFVGSDGSYQSSGTYRIVTREGVLGLSLYLRNKAVEGFEELERVSKEPEN